MTLTLAFASHRGRVRDHNEDALGLDGWGFQGDTPRPVTWEVPPGRRTSIVLCDGMGGHGSGEVASRIAAERLSGPVGEAEWRPELVAKEIARRFQDVSDAIVVDARKGGVSSAMGTTAVSLVIDPTHYEAVVSHVGDSRAYIMDDGVLSRLTSDDRRTADDSVLSQALGGGRLTLLDVHATSIVLRSGSLILLCSDGLTEMAGDDEIARLVQRGSSLDRVADSLIAAALQAGGVDNISVALVRVAEESNSTYPKVLQLDL